jgi:ribonuclease P protein component
VADVPARAGADGPRSKRGRLSRSAEFERVYRQGRSHGNRYLVVWTFPRDESSPGADPGEARLGVTVPRSVGGAVERNRVKRLLREAFTAESGPLPAGVDVVVQARPDARELSEREGVAGIRRELGELIAKAAQQGTG